MELEVQAVVGQLGFRIPELRTVEVHKLLGLNQVLCHEEGLENGLVNK